VYRNSLVLFRRPYAPLKWILDDLVRLAKICVTQLLSLNSQVMDSIGLSANDQDDDAKSDNQGDEAAACDPAKTGAGERFVLRGRGRNNFGDQPREKAIKRRQHDSSDGDAEGQDD
jgi:hypothetical protein